MTNWYATPLERLRSGEKSNVVLAPLHAVGNPVSATCAKPTAAPFGRPDAFAGYIVTLTVCPAFADVALMRSAILSMV